MTSTTSLPSADASASTTSVGIDSWKAEFYPTEAKDCPTEDAIAHSLRKWKGLRPNALRRHHAIVGADGELRFEAGAVFCIDGSTCALCAHHMRHSDGQGRCAGCPLRDARNGYPCDSSRPTENRSPFSQWLIYADPEPMIAALELALAKAQP